MSAVPQGLEALLEIEQIKQTKYRYARSVDTKDWAGLRECLTPDAESRYGDSAEPCSGAEAIVAYVATHLPATVSSAHTITQPEIWLTSATTAEGRWAFTDVLVDTKRRTVYRGAGQYTDTYAKIEDRWHIHRTGFLRFYEEAQSIVAGKGPFGPAPGGWLARGLTGLHVGAEVDRG